MGRRLQKSQRKRRKVPNGPSARTQRPCKADLGRKNKTKVQNGKI